MTSRRLLAILLLLSAANGAFSGYFGVRQMQPPVLLDLVFGPCFIVSIYIWYLVDAEERKFRRSMYLGGAIILLSPLSVPYYLYRSRQVGDKGLALLRYLGFYALCFVANLLGAFVFILAERVLLTRAG